MKLIFLCKSKIHNAVVTGAELHYEGSIGIDSELLALVGICEGERVCVWNVNNGVRLETYVIPLAAGSGQVVLNGAAARHCQVGDRIIVAAFCLCDEEIEPRMVLVDERNRFVRNVVQNGALDGARAVIPVRG